MTRIWLGLMSGIAFGFIIQRIGATNANKMAKAHLMIESDIPRFMLTAVAISALGVAGLQAAGVGRMMILPTSLVATGIAAAIFGIGWGLTGYCPGTAWAAAGEGRMDAIFALMGGFAGTAFFAHFHDFFISTFYRPTNMGPLSLADWTGDHAIGALILAGTFAIFVYIIGKLWKQGG
ncbi:MAG: YeeE/YedE thiosulfate transporter family protein [Desulfobacterales bacterium]